MTFRVLTTCSFSSARPARGPAGASPAHPRTSVRRAAALVAEKLQAPEGLVESARHLSDSDFLEQLRTEAARRGIAAPALALEDVLEQLPAEGTAAEGRVAPLVASGLRTHRRQRTRLRRRVQRVSASQTAPFMRSAEVEAPESASAKLNRRRFVSSHEELQLCAAIKVRHSLLV